MQYKNTEREQVTGDYSLTELKPMEVTEYVSNEHSEMENECPPKTYSYDDPNTQIVNEEGINYLSNEWWVHLLITSITTVHKIIKLFGNKFVYSSFSQERSKHRASREY